MRNLIKIILMAFMVLNIVSCGDIEKTSETTTNTTSNADTTNTTNAIDIINNTSDLNTHISSLLGEYSVKQMFYDGEEQVIDKKSLLRINTEDNKTLLLAFDIVMYYNHLEYTEQIRVLSTDVNLFIKENIKHMGNEIVITLPVEKDVTMEFRAIKTKSFIANHGVGEQNGKLININNNNPIEEDTKGFPVIITYESKENITLKSYMATMIHPNIYYADFSTESDNFDFIKEKQEDNKVYFKGNTYPPFESEYYFIDVSSITENGVNTYGLLKVNKFIP